MVDPVPLPADPDVPVGKGAEDNVELRRWNPAWFDPSLPFVKNKGFAPKTHLELVENLRLVDFERAVKHISSTSRQYRIIRDPKRGTILRAAWASE